MGPRAAFWGKGRGGVTFPRAIRLGLYRLGKLSLQNIPSDLYVGIFAGWISISK